MSSVFSPQSAPELLLIWSRPNDEVRLRSAPPHRRHHTVLFSGWTINPPLSAAPCFSELFSGHKRCGYRFCEMTRAPDCTGHLVCSIRRASLQWGCKSWCWDEHIKRGMQIKWRSNRPSNTINAAWRLDCWFGNVLLYKCGTIWQLLQEGLFVCLIYTRSERH